MEIKPNGNHRRYLRVLRGMTPAERLHKAFELSAFTRRLFMQGLRRRFPDLSEQDLKRIYLDRLDGCHDRNY